MQVHVEQHGQGPDVVLLHGAPSPPSDFAPIIEALGRTHRLLVPDLPGYGRSEPVRPFVLDETHRRLEDALLALGVRAAIFTGTHFGAYRAFQIAVRGRIRAHALVSLGGAAGFGPDERAPRKPFVEMFRQQSADPGLRQLLRGRMLSPAFSSAHPDAARRVEAWFDLAPADVIADEWAAALDAPDLHAQLAALDVPILARVGELDLASPLYCAERLARAVPRCTLQVVPATGHALLVEDPRGTADAIARWVGA